MPLLETKDDKYEQPDYYTEFEEVVSLNSNRALTWLGKRKELTEKYGWAIPNADAINRLVKERQLLEIGSGKGYWAYIVNKNGGNIYPTDIELKDNNWITVNDVCAYDIIDNPTIVPSTNKILMCWPPVNNSLAFDVVSNLDPSEVFFVGKLYSNIMATKEFYTYLTDNYYLSEKIEIPSWKNRNYLYIFKNNSL